MNMRIDHAELARGCRDIARIAGDAIMRIYHSDFAVNIALIEDHATTLGVVYAPALDEMYSAWCGGQAWFHASAQTQGVALRARAPATPLVVAGSRSHADARMQGALARIGAHEL